MMRYLISLMVIIGLIVVETSILPYLPEILRFYDFLVAFAVYLSLYQPIATGIPVMVIAGLAMDMLSGAPPGIYLASYLWVFLVFRHVSGWVRIGDHTLFFFLSIIGVGVQNLIFGIAAWSVSRVPFFTGDTGVIVLLQLFWALVTAPFLWLLFHFLFSDTHQASGTGETDGR